MAADHQKFNANSPSCMRTTVGCVHTHTVEREGCFCVGAFGQGTETGTQNTLSRHFYGGCNNFKRKNLLQTRIGAHTYTCINLLSCGAKIVTELKICISFHPRLKKRVPLVNSNYLLDESGCEKYVCTCLKIL
jgi:hypothetical protein